MSDTANRTATPANRMVVGQDGNGAWWAPASGLLTQARAESLLGHLRIHGQRDRYKIITIED